MKILLWLENEGTKTEANKFTTANTYPYNGHSFYAVLEADSRGYLVHTLKTKNLFCVCSENRKKSQKGNFTPVCLIEHAQGIALFLPTINTSQMFYAFIRVKVTTWAGELKLK